MKIKTKLALGLFFLFVEIIFLGGLGIFYLKRLSKDTEMILQDNQISIDFCSKMLKALDDIPGDTAQVALFEKNLVLEENNITEPGEKEAAAQVRALFDQARRHPQSFTQYKEVRGAILQILEMNQSAILHKNGIASTTASAAMLWLTVAVTLVTLIAFAFILNFPAVIARPIRILSEGIREVANKNYNKRIHLDDNSEFAPLAETFNTMAARLDEYEHSNLAELKLEKGRIETIINKMNDGVIGLDGHQHFLFLNARAEKLLNLDPYDLFGKDAEEASRHNDLLRVLLRSANGVQLKIFADEKESYFEVESTQILIDEGMGGRLIFLRNVTPFKELDKAKTNFIATISHELKTPLFAIKMSTQLLDDHRIGPLNQDQQDILTSLKNNAERLMVITAELLNMSQIETGQLQIRSAPARPEVILLRALQAVQQHAAQQNIRLCQELDDNLPSIYIDEEKIIWVMINLLTNAIKHSTDGSPVKVRVTLSGGAGIPSDSGDGAGAEAGSILFSVQDFGDGIDERHLPHVFDKYFKVPGTIGQSGTGLGLSISKEFIEAQGGKIGAASVPGKGSTFWFQLPIQNNPAQ